MPERCGSYLRKGGSVAATVKLQLCLLLVLKGEKKSKWPHLGLQTTIYPKYLQLLLHEHIPCQHQLLGPEQWCQGRSCDVVDSRAFNSISFSWNALIFFFSFLIEHKLCKVIKRRIWNLCSPSYAGPLSVRLGWVAPESIYGRHAVSTGPF